MDRQIEQLRRCEYIKEAEVKALCAKAREILVEESNVQRVDAPVTVRAARRSGLAHAGGARRTAWHLFFARQAATPRLQATLPPQPHAALRLCTA